MKGTASELPTAKVLATLISGVAGAVGWAFGAGVFAWALYQGWKRTRETQLAAARNELRMHFDQVVRNSNGHLFGAETGYSARCFGDLERAALDQIDAVIQRKLEEARAELARREEAFRLDERQRTERSGLIARQLAEWNDAGQKIAEVTRQLTNLDNELAAAALLGG